MHEKMDEIVDENNVLRERLGLSERQLSEMENKLMGKEEELSHIQQGGIVEAA